MLAEIQAAYSSANAALTILKGAINAKHQVDIREIAIEMQSHILALQESLGNAQLHHSELASVKDDIEKKLSEYEDWESEKEKHELFKPYDGVIVYRAKPNQESTQTEYWLCPNCFSEKMKGFLTKQSRDHDSYHCSRCSFYFDQTEYC